MSAKGTIFKTIANHLMQNVEGLQVVDKDRGQLENINQFVTPFPAVFISFGRFTYEPIGNGYKKGIGPIQFRVAYENYSDSYTGSVNQDLALKFFDFNESVQKALEGLSSDLFSPLELTADEDDQDHKNIIVTVFEYETTIINTSGSDDDKYVLTDAELKVKYVNKKDFPKREIPDNDFVINM